MNRLAPVPFAYPYASAEVHADPLSSAASRRAPEQHGAVSAELGRQQTRDPTVTGTSILAFKYADGIMMAGDTCGSYGSMARFRDLERVRPLGDESLIGATGEYSDFQYLYGEIDFLVKDDKHAEDGHSFSTRSLYSWLTRVTYNRRTYQMDPLYNVFILAGFRKPREFEAASKQGAFLGCIDMNGTSYEDDIIATGYGGYLAMPILRKEHRNDLSYNEAKALMEKCLKVLFYRDARTINKVQIATVTAAGPTVSDPYEIDTDWTVGNIVYPEPVKTTFPFGDDPRL